MLRFALLTVATVSLPLAAQVTTEVAPPQYAGVQTRVAGVFVTPIANIPMSAVVDISSMRIMPDGSTELRRTANHIARSSSGKIYNERRMLVPAAYQGQPRLLGIHTYDPQTRVSLTWTPFADVVHSLTLTGRQVAERKPFLVSVPGTTDQDLGTSTMSGITVRGMRRTRPVSMQGTGPAAKPIQITDEYWYSEDLHLIMLEKHDDPRTGEQIVSVVDVKTAEPPPTSLTRRRTTALWTTRAQNSPQRTWIPLRRRPGRPRPRRRSTFVRSEKCELLLAAFAEVCRPAADHNALDRLATLTAGLPCAAVHAVFQLKEAAYAVSIHVIGNG